MQPAASESAMAAAAVSERRARARMGVPEVRGGKQNATSCVTWRMLGLPAGSSLNGTVIHLNERADFLVVRSAPSGRHSRGREVVGGGAEVSRFSQAPLFPRFPSGHVHIDA